jgi:hypothetical protein
LDEYTTPRRVGDGVGAPNRIELVQKRGDVELGGVDGDAEPTGDHLSGKVYRIGFLDLTASLHFAGGSPRAQRRRCRDGRDPMRVQRSN